MKFLKQHMFNMPQWFILSMDCIIVFFSTVLAFLVRYNFNTQQIPQDFFASGLIATLAAYFVSSVFFQSYRGIVRHTNLQDTFKILIATFSANLSLFILNFLLSAYSHLILIPNSVLLISFFISFCMLVTSRIFIKEIFETLANTKRDPVLIFGAGDMGQVALKAILQNKANDWKVVAFIDDDAKKIDRNLEGVHIYGLNEVSKLVARFPVKRVFIAVHHISISRRNEVASFFIDLGIKVSILPSTQEWLDNYQSLKIREFRELNIENLLEREPIQINNQQINKSLKGKRVLITGAAGSIGSEIVKQVAEFQPGILILCDIAESPLHSLGLELTQSYPSLSYKIFIGNITDGKRMHYLFENFTPNIVFHAAAYKHVPMMEEHPREAVLSNILGTKIIADLSVKFSVERFVMISTDKAVNPTNVMGASKRVAEMYIQSLQENINKKTLEIAANKKETAFITTRFGNVLGSNGSVVPLFKAQVEKGGPVTVTHPDITRFFMTIPEACQLVLEAGVMGNGGEIFVFDMGKPIRIADLAHKVITLAGLKPDEDIKIVYTGLRPGEKLFEEVLSDVEPTLPTYNSKIKIAQVTSANFYAINYTINNIISSAKKGEDWDCVRLMKEMIPQFISNNSKFEKLDNQIASKESATGLLQPLFQKQ